MKNWTIVLGVVATAVAFSGRVVATRSSADHELADAEAAALRGGYCGNNWDIAGTVACPDKVVLCGEVARNCSEFTFTSLVPNGSGNKRPQTERIQCTVCSGTCNYTDKVTSAVPCGT